MNEREKIMSATVNLILTQEEFFALASLIEEVYRDLSANDSYEESMFQKVASMAKMMGIK